MVDRHKPSDEFPHRLELLCDDPYAYDYYEQSLRKITTKLNYDYELMNKYRSVYMIIDFKHDYDAVTFKIKYL